MALNAVERFQRFRISLLHHAQNLQSAGQQIAKFSAHIVEFRRETAKRDTLDVRDA